MRFMPRYLYGKLVLLVSSIVILIILAYGLINFIKQSNYFREIIKQHAVLMAKNLSLTCADYLILNDYGGMEVFLKRFAEFPDILEIQVYDSKGNVLSSIIHETGAPPKLHFGSVPLKVPDSMQTSVQTKDEQMIVLQPIIAGSMLGWVKVSYSLDTIITMKKIIWRNSFLLSIAGIIVSFIALLIVLKSPLKSIKKIADFARNLDKIKGDTLQVEQSVVEVEQLSTALNYASRELHSKENALISEKERYQILHNIAVELNKTLDIDEILNNILYFSRGLLKTEIAGIALYDDSGGVKKFIKRGEKEIMDNDLLKFIQCSLTPVKMSDIKTHPAFRGEWRSGHLELKNFLGYPLFSGKGRPMGSLYFANKLGGDFTEQDETVLRAIAADAAIIIERGLFTEELERFKRIIDDAFDLITITDRDGNIIYVNKAFETVTGYERDEVIGKKPNFLRSELREEEPYTEDTWKKLSEGLPWREEFINKRKDGRLFTVSTVIFPIISSDGNVTHFVAIQRDITEERKLYEQLLRSQKMEAIGTLTGGIAHDFNNILTAIVGYANLMHMKMGEDDPLRANVEQILRASERAVNLIQSLLAFSRKQIMEPSSVNLNHIIKTVEDLITKVIGEDIELKTILTDKDLTIMADSGQIEQVLINLCINARDAMPKGGLLTISTKLMELDKEYIKAHGYGKEGMYALISITDAGIGMDDKTREKIFEPFFTTKEVGKGTGLGLSIVYGIIKQHNGYINVYSELDKGTTFKVYLPVVESEVKQAKAETISSLKGGTEAVLVVEDDVILRKLIKDVLEGVGYKVIMAEDGEKAIERFMERKDEIKLALLDVIMPKKNGKEVYEEIKKIRPDIKVLFASGYTGNIIDKKEMFEEGLEFLLKPVSPKELLRKVREVLDR